jgi:uncharacterized protein (TIGR03000 family)
MRSIAWVAVLSFVALTQVAEAGRRGAKGSKGAEGSAGGSGGSAGGSGGSSGGSIGSYGSSGGSSGGVIVTPVVGISPDRASLVLHVPADATVYMLNQKMTIEGSVRNFVTPKLETGKVYSVNVRVEWERDGQKFVARGKQKIRSGDKVEVEAKLNDAGTSLLLAHRDGQKDVLELTADNALPATPQGTDAPGIANNSR